MHKKVTGQERERESSSGGRVGHMERKDGGCSRNTHGIGGLEEFCLAGEYMSRFIPKVGSV